MDLKIIDNFLDVSEFSTLINNTIGRSDGHQTEFRVISNVEDSGVREEDYWSWYLVNMIYYDDIPQNQIYSNICNIFTPRFLQVANFKTMIRIKMNAYPHTDVVKEHKKHIDYSYEHIGAVFSLNTCDGYTKFSDGTKVESIANRMAIFSPKLKHASTTCTNQKRRLILNMNYF